ncbi:MULTISPECIES: hypothetical protein [Streptosporangium]|uniref:Uncharacterized protein n=1 Tax=Streptosporangium brasiliense TaxID=47480 RepID=A0ABT9R9U9_9ACTN|nr:hypothetical protein [Streptosporangium brasiliense]MDP9865564.1 hypothetical protein [Streptosporangium brasiliense]
MPGEELGVLGGAELATIGGMLALGRIAPNWAATMKKIDLAGKLAAPAIGAAAIWALAQPWDDDAISKAWNDWRTVNLKVLHLRTREWDQKLAKIQAAWPEGADRRAFDKFMQVVYHEVQQFETAAGQMAGAVQSAQSNVNRIVNTCGLFIDSLLAIMISSEIMQLFGYRVEAAGDVLIARANSMPAGDPATAALKMSALIKGGQVKVRGMGIQAKATATKQSSALFLMGGTITAVVGISATVLFSLGDLIGLTSADNQFPQPQVNLDSGGLPGDASKTDFDDIKRGSVQRSGDEGWSYV